MKKVPLLKQYLQDYEAFQRGFVTFLNVMRADVADSMIKEFGTSKDVLLDIGNYVNVTSGRGSTGLGRRVGEGATRFSWHRVGVYRGSNTCSCNR